MLKKNKTFSYGSILIFSVITTAAFSTADRYPRGVASEAKIAAALPTPTPVSTKSVYISATRTIINHVDLRKKIKPGRIVS